MLKDYLTREEISKIEQFCADEKMYEAVRKALFKTVYSEGVVEKGETLEQRNAAFNAIADAYQRGEAITNEQIGANLRGLFEGIHTVQEGFARMKSLKNAEAPVESPFNEAI